MCTLQSVFLFYKVPWISERAWPWNYLWQRIQDSLSLALPLLPQTLPTCEFDYIVLLSFDPVSYTHLDVYKRQDGNVCYITEPTSFSTIFHQSVSGFFTTCSSLRISDDIFLPYFFYLKLPLACSFLYVFFSNDWWSLTLFKSDCFIIKMTL